MSKEKLAEFLSKDVNCGYQMPLTIKVAKKIKDGLIDMYLITEQTTLLDLGEKVPKTH